MKGAASGDAASLFSKNKNSPLRESGASDILCLVFHHGEVAQLVEHHVRNVGVESSNLFFSTIWKENEKRLSPHSGRAAIFFTRPPPPLSPVLRTVFSERSYEMKKNLGVKAWLYPMPVLIIGSYDAEGRPDAMNAAWGGISLEDRISICVDDSHKTTTNVLARKAFTVHVANAAQLVACDYVGVVSGNQDPNKLAKTGWTLRKSAFVDAPVIEELPMVLECELVSYDKADCRMVGRIVNIAIDEGCLSADGKIDVTKLDPITYDPVNHVYLRLGEKAGDAFKAGLSLK